MSLTLNSDERRPARPAAGRFIRLSTTAGPETAAQVAARIERGEAAQARERIGDLARHTPVLTSRSLAERCGGTILLKAENLQRTGSFKLRGALHKISGLGENARGVTAG